VVEKSGFKKLVRSGIELTAADAITVNLQLQVGDVQQSVEVTGTAPLLEAQSAAVSNLVGNRQLGELPINTRQFTALTILAPGAYVGSAGNLSGAVCGLRASNNSNLANLLSWKPDVPAALFHYREALRIRPAFGQAHYGYAAVLAQSGQIAEAITEAEAAVRDEPNSEAARNLLNALKNKSR
jgi:tetratricopeptide (TPR) repeat protein